MKSALILLVTLAIPLLSAQHPAVGVDEDGNEVAEISKRVFGNMEVEKGSFQYVAKLTVRFGNNQDVCSGIVVSSRSVLTVAQCVIRPFGVIASSVKVTLPTGGSYNFRSAEINIHPLYEFNYYSNNIALLKTNTPNANFIRGLSEYPRLISTEQFNGITISTPARVLGWGKTSRNAVGFPSKLQYGNVGIIRYCEDLEVSFKKSEIVCTRNNVAGICEGDFGGPLVTTMNTVVGLGVYRRDCSAQTDVPSVYYSLRSDTATQWLQQEPDLADFLRV